MNGEREVECGVMALAFSPSGKTLAAAEIDKKIRLWDTGTGKEATIQPLCPLVCQHCGYWPLNPRCPDEPRRSA